MVWGVKIPVRDGVRLNATVFKPRGQQQPLPVILILTPYMGDTYLSAGIVLRAERVCLRPGGREGSRELRGSVRTDGARGA
jgi:predicted acyl esterase